MDNMLLALALPPLVLVPAMGLLSRVESASEFAAELRRKTLHAGLGLAALWFPLLFTERWMVFVGLGLVLAWMTAVRRVCYLRRKFGRVLHDVARDSFGELWFALAIAFLLLMSDGGSYLYVVPLLILTLADGVAAIAGRLYPIAPLKGPARGKSLGGSAAFAACAFAVTFTALQLMTPLQLAPAAIIAVSIASLTAITEAISRKGTDNISVPIVAWLLLQLLVAALAGGWL
jgi:phytol kinase